MATKKKGGKRRKTAASRWVSPPGPPLKERPDRRRMVEAMRQHLLRRDLGYLKMWRASGVGITYIPSASPGRFELCFQCTVEKKLKPEVLKKKGIAPIPRVIRIENGAVIPTIVLERWYMPSAGTPPVNRIKRARVVRPGMSVGHHDANGGTIGTFVLDNQTQEVALLSNWHILCTPTGEVQDPVVQPGPMDSSNLENNRIGQLLREFIGADGDCAIASFEARRYSNRQLGVDNSVRSLRDHADVIFDDGLIKSGRTSGVTRGKVRATDLRIRMHYPSADGGTEEHSIRVFEVVPDPDDGSDQPLITQPGDSGSAWMALKSDGTPGNTMVGLNVGCAGNDPEVAIACYASDVFAALDISPLPLSKLTGRGSPR